MLVCFPREHYSGFGKERILSGLDVRLILNPLLCPGGESPGMGLAPSGGFG